jgi:geranylgeranyl diphosphate synthase type I
VGEEAVARIEAEMRAVLEAERRARRGQETAGGGEAIAPLFGMMDYHLGWVDARFRPEVGDGGKKLRGQLCLLACALAGGDEERALPLAAAVELLHNFTLVHDDIQDRSPTRRHRPTVWSLWGVGQAINVGDGLYAVARLALLRLVERGTPPALALEVARRCERTLLHILEGQYLDLSFENDWAATTPLYLRMIEAKTATLIRFCLEAGALVGNGDAAMVAALGQYGRALGMGFQVRDDVLGIWGAPEVTGKPPAGDLRSRKKSLPVLIAMERATAEERAVVERAYDQAELTDGMVADVLRVLDRTGAGPAAQSWAERYHAEALDALGAAGGALAPGAALRRLAVQLAARAF